MFVASNVFVDAAKSQGTSLGIHPASVYVEHPIQDRTDDEMRAIADQAIDALIKAITGPRQS